MDEIKMSQPEPTVPPAHSGRWLTLALWIAVVGVVAAVGSWATLPKIPTWYVGLAKPWFTPPNEVFGPVWSLLYLMMAVAVWRVGARRSDLYSVAAGLFISQLALNALWSPVFFGLEAPKAALAIILTLSIVLVATIAVFWRVDRVAALLLVPYLAWVCYAAALNAAIAALN